MDFDNSAQVDALAKLPPEPPKAPERSAWTVVPRAITSGAGKIGAAIVEGVAAMSPGDEELRRNPGRTAFSAEDLGLTARSARDFERTLRPDPATASTAEQLVYGLGSGLTQAGIGAIVAGPAGAAAALGGGEGATVTDDLQRQGVDNTTARAAGAVTGVVNAASVALPMFGPTLKATAGLYLAGGPGGFMAQQALTSQILQNAGYDKIAEQFDARDPLGLALSALVPLPFAGYGAMRNIRTAKAAKGIEKPGSVDTSPAPVQETPETMPVPRETVDAAMVHNLTLQRQAQEVAQRTQSAMPDVDRAWRDLSEAPKISDFDTTPATTATGALDDFVLSRQQGKQWAALNVREFTTDAGDVVYTASLEVGADEFPKGTGAATTMYLEALNIAKQRGMGWQSEGVRSDNALAIYRRLTDAGIPFREVDGVSAIDAQALVGVDLQKVAQTLAESASKKADALGAAPRAPDAAQPPPIPKPDPAPAALAETIAKAQEELTAFQASGKTLDEYVTSKELPPAVNNLLIGLAETLKNPARTKALLDMVGKADAKADPANATADAVETVRTLTDDQLTNTAADPTPAAPDALMQSVSERVAAVELTNPDMPIGVDDSGNPITVRDELARIRKEAFEGTDTELGAADADLVNVAANCALTNGG